MATQTIKVTQRITKTKKRGLAAITGGSKKRGRPAGSKDTKPRKTRSDKGKKRGSYTKRVSV